MVIKITIIKNMQTSREFTFSTRYFKGSIKINNLFVEGNNIYIDGYNILFFKGELLFNSSLNNILEKIKKEGITSLIHLNGEFVIVYYNNYEKKLYIINDKLGLEPLYYFYRNDEKFELTISTDFWRIVDLYNPVEDDLNTQTIKELIIFHKPLFWKTIIKNINIFPAATVGIFSIINIKSELNEYWDFKFNPDNKITIDDAYHNLDKAINSTIREIIQINGRKKVYSIGISGGIDTRIIPFYLLQNDVKNLKSFIIGERRPHRIFLSRDHKNARNIAKYYEIEHYECEYDSEPYEKKIFYDVRFHPLRSSNILKVLTSNIPKFDVLITGGYGTIVGGHLLFKNINSLSKEELVETIAATLSRINPKIKQKNIYHKILYMFKNLKNVLLNRPSTGRRILKRKNINGIINIKEFTTALNKINKYVIDEENKGKDNYDIFMKYHLLLSTKYGAFESLSGTRKSYSIYFPLSLEEIVHWQHNFIIGRKVLEYLIFNKTPELTKIPGQNREIPIYYKYKRVKKIIQFYHRTLSFITYFIRGSGLYYDKWIKTKDFLKFSKKTLIQNNEYFHQIFDVKEILSNIDNMNELVFQNIIKIKYILDLILSREYKKWFEQDSN